LIRTKEKRKNKMKKKPLLQKEQKVHLIIIKILLIIRIPLINLILEMDINQEETSLAKEIIVKDGDQYIKFATLIN
jgi:hypothetical protein